MIGSQYLAQHNFSIISNPQHRQCSVGVEYKHTLLKLLKMLWLLFLGAKAPLGPQDVKVKVKMKVKAKKVEK